MIKPLVPPAEGYTNVPKRPALVHITEPSAVVAPGAVLHTGVIIPVVPPGDVTTSTFPLLSMIRGSALTKV
jgi:hypothetical protein